MVSPYILVYEYINSFDRQFSPYPWNTELKWVKTQMKCHRVYHQRKNEKKRKDNNNKKNTRVQSNNNEARPICGGYMYMFNEHVRACFKISIDRREIICRIAPLFVMLSLNLQTETVGL